MTRVLLIGAGKGGERVLNHLMPIPSVAIVGVTDVNPAAPAIKIAQQAGLPVFLTDPLEVLRGLNVDIVFDLTGNTAIRTALSQMSNGRFEVATGEVTRLFIRTVIEANEKDSLLKKHLEISLMISQSRTLEQAFDIIVAGGMEITNMQAGSVAIYDREKELFTLLAQKGLPERLSQRATFPLHSGGLTQYLLTNRKPVIIPDLAKNELFNSSLLLEDGIRSMIAIPLLSEQELLGILFYNSFAPQNFPDGLVDILRQFMLEAVIAIQRQKAIAQIRQLASRDALTGLYNRNQFLRQLKEAMFKAGQDHETVSLLICDLDRFKEINETLGQQYGDQVLRQTAACITQALSEGNAEDHARPLLFRSGGDEISIIFPDITAEKLLAKALLVRKAVQAISQQVYFPMDISIGGAVYPDQNEPNDQYHSESNDQLIIRTARALMIAKREEDRICIGAPDNLHGSDRVNIIFEPIVDTAQNRVIGYEALSRDARGKLGIQELFKKYAEWGELEELKRDCFLAQIKRAEALGLAKVFLNIDSHILMQCEWVIKPPDLEVVLEVSESESIQDVESYLALAERWRDKGFQFAIDDFGAGFISLPFLSRLKPEYIKIDRSVVLQSVASSEFRLFLKKLVTALQGRTCHQMIAEGIETETESRRVVEVGIHLVQGFLLKEQGHPVLLNVPKD